MFEKIKSILTGKKDKKDEEREEIKRLQKEIAELKKEQVTEESSKDDERKLVLDKLMDAYETDSPYKALNDMLNDEYSINLPELVVRIMYRKLEREWTLPYKDVSELEQLEVAKEVMDDIEGVIGTSASPEEEDLSELKNVADQLETATDIKENISKLRGNELDAATLLEFITEMRE